MAMWNAADCLSQFNDKAGRPYGVSETVFTDVRKYALLSRAQSRVVALLAGRMPDVLYPAMTDGSLPTLTTSDGGYTYTFGTDTYGNSLAPIGNVALYANEADAPNAPLRLGVDYYRATPQSIAFPNGNTYGGTLYWRGITPPADIDAAHDPGLYPEASRELIVIEAARQYGTQQPTDALLVAAMQAEWQRAWPEWCLVWQDQFRSGGAWAPPLASKIP